MKPLCMPRKMLSCILLLVLLIVHIDGVWSIGLLGIDFGSRYIKVGIVQPGKSFEIVLNEASKRKTDNVVAFNQIPLPQVTNDDVSDKDDITKSNNWKVFESLQRLFSSEAVGFAAKKPENAFWTNDILDQLFDYSQRGSVKLMIDQNEVEFKLEEILGMILQNIKILSENHVFNDDPSFGRPEIVDCVITVPAGYDSLQRNAILNAADIAGLNVLSLINENSAAAINYAIYKNFDELAVDIVDENIEKKVENVIFFNMGHKHLQISIVEFSALNNTLAAKGLVAKDKPTIIPIINIRSHVDLKSVGGNVIDQCLVDFMIDDFIAHHAEEDVSILKQDKKLRTSLERQGNKIKEILSANEQIPVSIESMFNDKSLTTSFSRERLENCKFLVNGQKLTFEEAIANGMETALIKANLSIDQIGALELLGGSVRVPKVKSSLDSFVRANANKPLELGQHLNGDEAMALGAVFMAANMSKAFRVKRILFTDYSPDRIDVKMSSSSGWGKEHELFAGGSTLGSKKTLTLHHDENIKMDIFSTNQLVSRLELSNIKGLSESYGGKFRLQNNETGEMEAQKPKIAITFKLTLNSTLDIASAEARFIELIEIKVPVKKLNATKNESQPEGMPLPEVGDSEIDESSVEAVSGQEASDNAKEAEQEFEITKKEKVRKMKVDIKYSYDIKGPLLTPADISAAKSNLATLRTIESERAELDFVKNRLEALIFSSRGTLRDADGLTAVVPEPELESFFSQLEDLEDWLYSEEAKTTSLKVFLKKESKIKQTVRTYMMKLYESKMRDDVEKSAIAVLNEAKLAVERIKDTRPWIQVSFPERINDLKRAINQFEEYFVAAKTKQDSLDPTDEPFLISTDVMKKMEPVHFYYELLLKTKKPKEDKLPPNDQKSEDTDVPEPESFQSQENVENDNDQDEPRDEL